MEGTEKPCINACGVLTRLFKKSLQLTVSGTYFYSNNSSVKAKCTDINPSSFGTNWSNWRTWTLHLANVFKESFLNGCMRPFLFQVMNTQYQVVASWLK